MGVLASLPSQITRTTYNHKFVQILWLSTYKFYSRKLLIFKTRLKIKEKSLKWFVNRIIFATEQILVDVKYFNMKYRHVRSYVFFFLFFWTEVVYIKFVCKWLTISRLICTYTISLFSQPPFFSWRYKGRSQWYKVTKGWIPT